MQCGSPPIESFEGRLHVEFGMKTRRPKEDGVGGYGLRVTVTGYGYGYGYGSRVTG
jgi:hypothetical protein